MELLGADPDLGSQPELAAVGESRGGVSVDAGRIHLAQEAPGCGAVFGHDALAVFQAVAAYVAQGLVEGADGADGEGIGEEFRAVALFGGGVEQGVRVVPPEAAECFGSE